MTTSGSRAPDHLGEALRLEALHRHEGRHEPVPETVDEPFVGLESVQSRPEVGRQSRPRVCVVHAVGVAHHRLRRLEPTLDSVKPCDEQRRDDQMRARRSVTAADLDACPRATLVWDATECGAVVVAPVGVGGCERVRQDALVRVDRRPEKRHQTGRMVDHTCDELRSQRAQPLRTAVVAERVVPVLGSEGKVHVEARPALVGKRPAHEGRDQTLTGGDLLHGGLQHEGAVCGVRPLRSASR